MTRPGLLLSWVTLQHVLLVQAICSHHCCHLLMILVVLRACKLGLCGQEFAEAKHRTLHCRSESMCCHCDEFQAGSAQYVSLLRRYS